MKKRFGISAVLSLALVLTVATRVSAQAGEAETSSPELAPGDPGPYRPAPETRASGGGGRASKAKSKPAQRNSTIRDTSVHRRPLALGVMAYVPWIYGIGIGLSTAFEIPVVHDGFIRSVNDAFSIEPSFAFAYLDYYGRGDVDGDYALLFRPAVAGKWSFYLQEQLRVYALVNFGYSRVNHHWDDASASYKRGYNYFYGEPAAGVEWSFSPRCALRAEVAPHGVRAGLSILF
ncbi:MAG TPA: hypothetical protein VFZ61_15595 [Polyangiales bacterium]